jgi:hypothetical protein
MDWDSVILGMGTTEMFEQILSCCNVILIYGRMSPERPPIPKPIKSKEDLIAQNPNCFNGIGKFEGEYHITTNPSVPPVIHPPQRVPISLKDDIKKELY